MQPYERVVITVDAGTLAEVKRRLDPNATKGKPGNNVSGMIGASLARYYEMLRRERAALRPQFSAAECGLILEACKLITWQPASIPLLHAHVAGEPAETFRRWDVDGAALVAQLRALSYGQDAALVDAVERWWLGLYRQESPHFGKLLAEPEEKQP